MQAAAGMAASAAMSAAAAGIGEGTILLQQHFGLNSTLEQAQVVPPLLQLLLHGSLPCGS